MENMIKFKNAKKKEVRIELPYVKAVQDQENLQIHFWGHEWSDFQELQGEAPLYFNGHKKLDFASP